MRIVDDHACIGDGEEGGGRNRKMQCIRRAPDRKERFKKCNSLRKSLLE